MEAHDQVVSELEAHRTGECTGENRTDGPSAPLTSTADDPRHEGHGSRKGWLANQDTRSGVQVAIQMLLAWLANQDTRSGVQVAIQMLLKWRRTRGTHGGRRTVVFAVGVEWRRTRGTHGGRHEYCRPVAMEAIRQPGYYVRRRAWAVFSKVGRKKGAAKQWTVASRECRWRSC